MGKVEKVLYWGYDISFSYGVEHCTLSRYNKITNEVFN